MKIKETALKLGEQIYGTKFYAGYPSGNRLIDFAEALVAELAKENKPVYAFRRKGLDYFCTCDERRYKELAQKPTLFEVKVLYTLSPIVEQIEQETAEASALNRGLSALLRLMYLESSARKNFAHLVDGLSMKESALAESTNRTAHRKENSDGR